MFKMHFVSDGQQVNKKKFKIRKNNNEYYINYIIYYNI